MVLFANSAAQEYVWILSIDLVPLWSFSKMAFTTTGAIFTRFIDSCNYSAVHYLTKIC